MQPSLKTPPIHFPSTRVAHSRPSLFSFIFFHCCASYHLPSRRLQCLFKPYDPQTLASSQLPPHQGCCRHHRVVPVPKHCFHVAGNALQNDSRDGDERTVFSRRGQNAVLLRKQQRRAKSRRLGSRKRSHNTNKDLVSIILPLHSADLHINLKEGVQHMDELRL